jgi:hypothetical protein
MTTIRIDGLAACVTMTLAAFATGCGAEPATALSHQETAGEGGAEGSTSPDGPAPVPTAGMSSPWLGVGIPTCGGDDSPSVLFRVAPPADPALTCALARPDGTFDEVWAWRALAVGTVPFAIPDTGSAASCDARGCVAADQATLTIEFLSAVSASGSYTIALPGVSRSERFRVSLCPAVAEECGG